MKYSNETYPIRTLFNVDYPETCITRIVTDVTSLDRDHVPQVHDYWYSDKLKDVLNYLADPRGDALYISGSTGNGKTSLTVASFFITSRRRSFGSHSGSKYMVTGDSLLALAEVSCVNAAVGSSEKQFGAPKAATTAITSRNALKVVFFILSFLHS